MGGKTPGPLDRWAVWTAHDERCWICQKPVEFLDMELEHAVPQDFRDKPTKLATILAGLGLPADFSIDDFENWRPSHSICNNKKSSRDLLDTPRWSIWITRSLGKSRKARELAEKHRGKKPLLKAISLWAEAKRDGTLDEISSEAERAKVNEFLKMHIEAREPELRSKPVALSSLIEILHEDGSWQTIRGPYGVGGGLSQAPSVMRCGSCGGSHFNGPRCVLCGAMDD